MGSNIARDVGNAAKGRGPRPRTARFNDNAFVQYELDKAQLAACKGWDVSDGDIMLLMQEEVDNGYKFNIKWDSYGECYGVFMQPTDGEHGNAGIILTGRGSSVGKCVKQCLYKHRVCLDGDWTNHTERRGSGVIDD